MGLGGPYLLGAVGIGRADLSVANAQARDVEEVSRPNREQHDRERSQHWRPAPLRRAGDTGAGLQDQHQSQRQQYERRGVELRQHQPAEGEAEQDGLPRGGVMSPANQLQRNQEDEQGADAVGSGDGEIGDQRGSEGVERERQIRRASRRRCAGWRTIGRARGRCPAMCSWGGHGGRSIPARAACRSRESRWATVARRSWFACARAAK